MTPDVEPANWFLQRPLRSHARSYSFLWGKSRYLNEIAAMMTAEDCRRRAAESLHTAEAATDPKTSASLRRLSDAWATLAGQIEKDSHTERQWSAAGNQSHQTGPRKVNTDTAQVADILRDRLQLSDFDGPKS